jgi:uncharacterized membrane-anchored protein
MALYGSRVFGLDLPIHLEIMTHSESVHLCAELKTGILAVLTDTSGLGDSYGIVIITVISCLIIVDYYYAHVNAIRYHYYN